MPSQFLFPNRLDSTDSEQSSFNFPNRLDSVEIEESSFNFPNIIPTFDTDIDAIMSAIGKFENDYSFGNLNYTDALAEKFGATEGPDYTDQEGKTYKRAIFPNPELGEDATRWRAKQIWKDVDKDPVEFVKTWTGLKEDDDTVINYSQEIKKNLPPLKTETEDTTPGFNFPNILPEQREVPFLGIKEEPERTMAGIDSRFMQRFLEYTIPFGYDPKLPEAEHTREIIADLVGGGLGMMTGMTVLGAVTGGATWLQAPAKGKKLLDVAKTARTLVKSGRIKGAAKYLGIGSSGLLGTAPWIGKNYLNTMAKLTIISPKLAKAVDLGARNLVTFNAYGQSMMPLSSSISDRLKVAEQDFYNSLMFGVVGMPRILGIPKAKYIEPGALFAAGVGGDFFKEDKPIEERIIQGLGLVGFHWAGQKASKAYVDGKMRNALTTWGYTPKEAERILSDKKLLNTIMSSSQGKTSKVAQRPIEEQNIFVNKNKKLEQSIDLLNIYTNKKGQSMVTYRDLQTGARHTTTGKDFFSAFKKRNKIKTILEKEREKGLIVDDKTPVETIPKKGEKGYNAWNKGRVKIKSLQKKVGLADNDYRNFLKLMTGKSSSKDLTSREIAKVLDTMKPVKQFKKLDMNNEPLASGLLNKINEKFRFPLSKFFLPSSATLRGIADKYNSKAALKLSDAMLSFSLRTAPIKALGTRFVKGIKKRYKLSIEDLQSVISLVDPKRFGKFPLTKKIKDGVIVNEKGKKVKIKDEVLKDYNSFMEMNFLWMANAGVEVRVFNSTRTGSKFVPIWSAQHKRSINSLSNKEYGTLQGMKTKLKNEGKTSAEIKKREAKFLTKTITGQDVKAIGKITRAKVGDLIKLKDGTEVKLTKVDSRKVDDYYPRVLTQEAIALFKIDGSFKERMLESLIKNDPKLQKIKSANLRQQKAEKMLDEMTSHIDERGVFGSQFARTKIDLPARVAFDKEGLEIPLKDYNVKKGDVVKGREIDKIIDVYERNFIDVISKYTDKVSHIVPTYEFYGRRGVKGKKAQRMLNNLEMETKGDKEISSWAKVIIEQQANAKFTEVPPAFKPIWSFAANIGLSSPRTGFKNLLLGQVQTFTTFNGWQMARAYREILSNPKKWNEVSKSIGTREMGIHELEAMKHLGKGKLQKLHPVRLIGRAGFMQETEAINRLGASVTGLFTARQALKVLTGQATPWKAKMSQAQARHYLETTFKLDVNKILLSKRRTLTLKEETKVMQMAHIMSQGSPQLPFIPSWMAKGIAKPLTLFYRTAYRITENVGQNVVRPLIEQGNPLPAMKYLGGSAVVGGTMIATNYFALQKEKNKYNDFPREVLDAMSRAETLAVFGSFFDERSQSGDFVDNIFIARILADASNQASHWYSGRKTAYDASIDWAKANIPLFNDVITVWENNAKPEFAEIKRFRKMQRDWVNAVGDGTNTGEWDPDDNVRNLSYKAINASFWGSDSDKEKASLYYAELTEVANSFEKSRWTCIQATDKARASIKNKIEKTRPVTISHTSIKSGKSDYRRFVYSLSNTDKKRLFEIEKKWRKKSDAYWIAINKYSHLEVPCE